MYIFYCKIRKKKHKTSNPKGLFWFSLSSLLYLTVFPSINTSLPSVVRTPSSFSSSSRSSCVVCGFLGGWSVVFARVVLDTICLMNALFVFSVCACVCVCMWVCVSLCDTWYYLSIWCVQMMLVNVLCQMKSVKWLMKKKQIACIHAPLHSQPQIHKQYTNYLHA